MTIPKETASGAPVLARVHFFADGRRRRIRSFPQPKAFVILRALGGSGFHRLHGETAPLPDNRSDGARVPPRVHFFADGRRRRIRSLPQPKAFVILRALGGSGFHRLHGETAPLPDNRSDGAPVLARVHFFADGRRRRIRSLPQPKAFVILRALGGSGFHRLHGETAPLPDNRSDGARVPPRVHFFADGH